MYEEGSGASSPGGCDSNSEPALRRREEGLVSIHLGEESALKGTMRDSWGRERIGRTSSKSLSGLKLKKMEEWDEARKRDCLEKLRKV